MNHKYNSNAKNKANTIEQSSPKPRNKAILQQIRFLIILQLIIAFIIVAESLRTDADEDEEIFLGIIDFEPQPEIIAKAQITSLVDDIFSNNRRLLNGIEEVVVYNDNIRLLRDDSPICNDHILGAFSGKKILIKDSGEEVNEHTLYHEIGHNVWRQMDETKKDVWRQLFKRQLDTFSRYANVNENENFAENFACYFSDLNGCREKMHQEKMDFVERMLSH